jgi:hypothetical protein
MNYDILAKDFDSLKSFFQPKQLKIENIIVPINQE